MLTKKIPVVIGDIFIENKEMSKVNLSEIGFSFLSEGLYERLTVEEHLKLYRDLYSSNESIQSILRKVHLEEKRTTKVKELSYSEQKRILFAKLLIQNPELFIFEEPDQNVDFETQRIFMLIIEQLRNEGKSVLLLMSNMESAITIADRVFKLDENGLQEIQMASESEKEESEDQQNDDISQEEIQPVRFEKIPTKVNEKIVLFDPPEIAYIESNDGQTFLHIKGEEFPTTFTLNELENRLQHFGFFRCHRSYIVNLQKVRLSPASTLEILGGKSLLSTIASMIIVVFGIMLTGYQPENVFVIAVASFTSFFFIGLGTLLGLFAKSVMEASVIVLPFMFIFGFGSMSQDVC